MALRRFHPLRHRLESHFVFEVDGQRIAYCYIRKNACSAFKHLMLDAAGYDGPRAGSIGFLYSRYPARGLAHVLSSDWRMFVYRDPIDRAASLFRSKMIMQKGAKPFLANYRQITSSDPNDATFSRFVTEYLTRRNLDVHARDQSSHLLPIRYNSVSTLGTLHDDVQRICGAQIADTYFSRPTNPTSSHLSQQPSSDVPVHVLKAHYEDTGELPSKGALLTPDLEASIRHIYRRDYALDPAHHNGTK
jgi:hypothetical protein